jgi:hypothetical protein
MNYETKPQPVDDLDSKDVALVEVGVVEQDSRKPQSLSELNDEEYDRLDRQVCRTVDLIILYVHRDSR